MATLDSSQTAWSPLLRNEERLSPNRVLLQVTGWDEDGYEVWTRFQIGDRVLTSGPNGRAYKVIGFSTTENQLFAIQIGLDINPAILYVELLTDGLVHLEEPTFGSGVLGENSFPYGV